MFEIFASEYHWTLADFMDLTISQFALISDKFVKRKTAQIERQREKKPDFVPLNEWKPER